MRFGINLPNYSDGATPETLLAHARIVEAMGFHAVMISDHVVITEGVRERYPEPFWDPFTTAAWLAGQTSRIDVGTTVIVLPYRHPILMGRMVRNIDRLSGERFIFGVGVGSAVDEFEMLGIPFNRRGRIANEYLEVMQQYWTQSEVDYTGEFITLKGVAGVGATPGRAAPPLWVGGRSESALRRAVRFGDAWHPNLCQWTWLEDATDRLRELAAEAGKPVPAIRPRISLDVRDSVVSDPERYLGTGSKEQIREDLDRLVELGADFVLFDWYRLRDFETIRDTNRAWHMLTWLSDTVIDVAGERLRDKG